jgi:Ni/Co efflux regulator RcnB
MASHPSLQAVVVAAALLFTPLASFAQGGPPQDDRDHHEQGHDDHQQQGPSHDRGPEHGNDNTHYDFRDNDRAQLQSHYQKNLSRVDRSHRPHFEPGQPIPQAYRHSITVAPASVRRGLPPPPAGYTIGYYQGYTVVYNPSTQIILSVLDLLSQ